MPVGLPEFVDNPENRCPVVLLVDTSRSMSGAPLLELQRGLDVFKAEVQQDAQASLSVEVAIITFGRSVSLAQDFTTVDDFTPPTLQADGLTPMAEAIEKALDLLDQRKASYRENGVQYYRPWIFLITDGAPTDRWQQAAERLHQAEYDNKLLFFAVGVEGADFDTLKQIATPQRPPVLLNGLDFSSLFMWLSSSMRRVSQNKVGDVIALPPVGWGQIST
ncbi:MAG: VWA domain-containing protein [Synechocystis sp.]|nr:VWA domain-containing protein [Synechocystis sp.]